MTWLTFHSCFDFGYLIKSIVGQQLPVTEKEFFEMHKILFPRSYDIKMLMKFPNVQAAKLRGGLQDVSFYFIFDLLEYTTKDFRLLINFVSSG